MIREIVVDGEPVLAVDTEEEFNSVLGSGVGVMPPSWEDAMAWCPYEESTVSLEEILAADDDPYPTQEDESDPPGWFIRRLWAWVQG